MYAVVNWSETAGLGRNSCKNGFPRRMGGSWQSQPLPPPNVVREGDGLRLTPDATRHPVKNCRRFGTVSREKQY